MPLHDFFHARRILTSLILILVVIFLALMIAHPVSGQTCTPIAFGNPPTAGSITSAGQVNCYTFAGETGDVIRVLTTVTSGTFDADIEVFRPNGTKVCDTIFTKLEECILDADGEHKINVFAGGAGTSTGAYLIHMQRLNDPECDEAAIFGNPPLAQTHALGAENCFTFTGAVNDVIRVLTTRTSGTFDADIEVFRPNGTKICDTIFTKLEECTLDTAGRHTITVFAGGDGKSTGGYLIHAQRLNNPLTCAAISFGNPPLAQTHALGAENCFTFTGAVGDVIRVLTTRTSGTFDADIEIFRPNGTKVCDTIFTKLEECMLDTAGRHTITVFAGGAGTSTGGYLLHVQRLNNPLTCTPLHYDVPSATQTHALGAENCFTIEGRSGREIRVGVTRRSGTFDADIEIFRPDGTKICDTIFTDLNCTLDTTGQHTITVFAGGAGTSTGTYTAALTCVSGLCPDRLNAVPLRNYTTDTTPTLTWNWVLWAISYRVELFDNPGMTGTPIYIFTGAALETTVTPPLPGGKRYYWRVRAVGVGGRIGLWSAPEGITVE